MKSKIILMSVVLLSWGTLAQASGGDCPCVDKETLTINQAYHQSALLLDNAVGAKLKNVELIAMMKTAGLEHQARIKELSSISVNAGIPDKPSDLSLGFQTRSAQETERLATLSGTDLDRAYLEFSANELQRLLTAFDTYFITDVTTPTLKVWTKTERSRLMDQYTAARALQQKIAGNTSISYSSQF